MRAAMFLAARRPPCMATWATWGSGLPSLPDRPGQVADGEDLGVAGQRQVGPHRDLAAPPLLHAQGVGEGAGPHARHPHRRWPSG